VGKRREGLFDALAAAPWPIGILFGAVGFFTLRYGVPAWFAGQDNVIASALGKGFAGGALAPFAWVVLGLGGLASVASFLSSLNRRRLLESRSDLDSLRDISWLDFERLVGEVFRRRGYAIQELGGSGADGGVDLMLRRDGAVEIVQCKQWKNRQVTVSTVREVFGLLQHHGARKAWFVCCGEFTKDAKAFAAGKPIELVAGSALVDAIASVRSTAPRVLDEGQGVQPTCPLCSAQMTKRSNRRNGEQFWGCSKFPACRGTRPAA
jgi:restriction system protein